MGLTKYDSMTKSNLCPVYVDKVLLEYSHIHFFTYCLKLQWQSWVIVTDICGPQSLLDLLSSPLHKKLANPYYRKYRSRELLLKIEPSKRFGNTAY